MLLGFLRGVITLALLAAFFVWLVITNYYAADDETTTVSFTPIAPSTSPTNRDFVHPVMYVNNVVALSTQMIGALATLCFLWYADRTSARSVAWVSFLCAALFVTSWLATHSFFLADGFYTRDAGNSVTSYSYACENSLKSGQDRIGDKPDKVCNVVRGGAALSVIVGLIQGALLCYTTLQLLVVGKSAADGQQNIVRTVALVAMLLALVGQLLRAAASLRLAQVATKGDAVYLFGFFGGSVGPSAVSFVGSQILPALGVHVQTLAVVTAYACLVHCTKSPSEVPPATDKPTSRRVTAIVGFVVAFFTAGFTTTAMIWDARIVHEDVSSLGNLCGSGGISGNCPAYRTGIAGEVILAAAAWIIFVLFCVALKRAMSGDEPGDRSKLHGLVMLAGFLALVGLIFIWIIVDFVTAVTYKSKAVTSLNTVNHMSMLGFSFWCALAFAAYVYWFYSSRSGAVTFGAFFGTLAVTFGWVMTQYPMVRDQGDYGAKHIANCAGKTGTFETDPNNKECALTVAPAVLSWLFGLGEAGISALFLLIVLFWLLRGNKEAGATSIWQKLLLLSSITVLVGLFLWNVVLFKAIPENLTATTPWTITWLSHYVLLVVTVLSLFGTGFLAVAKDQHAVSRAAAMVGVICGAACLLGWIAVPASAYWIEKGKTPVCASSSDGSALCQATRTGVAGLYIHVIANTVSTALCFLIAFTNKPDATPAAAPATTTTKP